MTDGRTKTGMTARTRKVGMGVSLETQLKDRLDKLARVRKESRSDVVADLLEKQLKRLGK